jgi:hypothetical protein
MVNLQIEKNRHILKRIFFLLTIQEKDDFDDNDGF